MKKILILLFLTTTIVFSQLTSVFNLQGVLRLPTGKAAADKSYNFTFKMYTVAEGGEPLSWVETQSIEVKNGIYNTLIGSRTPFSGLAFDRLYYIGISVDGGSEMVPRVQLTAAPYALSLQGTNNKVPNSGAVTLDTISYHKSIDGVDRIKFDKNGATRVKSILVVENELEVKSNGGLLDLVGSDHVYLEFFPKGKAAGRKTWIGYGGSTTKDLTISSEIEGGNINLATTGAGTGVVASKVTAGNLMYKVAEVTSENFNTTSLTISGLNSDIHKRYKVFINVYVNNFGADRWNYFYFNGDATNGRYKGEAIIDFHGSGLDAAYAGNVIYTVRNGWGQDGYLSLEFTIQTGPGLPKSVFGEGGFLNVHNPVATQFMGFYNQTTSLNSITFGGNGCNYGAGTITVYALP